ncbi:hypothetical protein LC586_17250 [Nostoc sp. CHAB 5714]|uniref:Uncharacterized protein n=1 Tax=Nostoc favosum CHAB5714 TaxID=2780399 RepID=A0ABS8I9T8_9NOSO|nr:hypothetical protein [Nostoc favosum CHAB5714]
MAKLAAFFNTRYRVSVLACTIASATLGVELSLTEQSVHALDVNLLTCPGSATTSYNPGLTNTEQQTTIVPALPSFLPDALLFLKV